MILRSPPPKRRAAAVVTSNNGASGSLQTPRTDQIPNGIHELHHASQNGFGKGRTSIVSDSTLRESSRARSVGPVELPQPIPLSTTKRGQSPVANGNSKPRFNGLETFRSPASDPTEARIAYYDERIREVIAERDKVLKFAKEVEQSKIIALKEVKEAFGVEKKQWMDICDALQTVHNFAHGRAQLELDEERLRYYDEHGSFVRQSKIDILMRDHKIHQFQSAEFWLLHDKRELEEELKEREERIVELVQEIEDEREENALERDAEVQRLEQNHHELDTAHSTLRRQKENLEGKLKHEREALEDVKAKIGDLEGRLGRTQLQLTSAQNELSAKDREIQTWHRMEKKDARELDELRRERVDVGLRLKEMEDSVNQGEQEARVERERIEAKAKKEKKTLEKRISQLEAQLEEVRETILATAASPELGEKEQEPTPTPPPQSQPKSRPRRPVRRKSPEAQDVATDDSEREVQQPAVPKNAKKRKADRAEPELKAPVIPKKKRKLGGGLGSTFMAPAFTDDNEFGALSPAVARVPPRSITGISK